MKTNNLKVGDKLIAKRPYFINGKSFLLTCANVGDKVTVNKVGLTGVTLLNEQTKVRWKCSKLLVGVYFDYDVEE